MTDRASPRSVGKNAALALLLEVTGTPKPGNVDREREYEDLRFEHFMAGSVGAQPGLGQAALDTAIGPAFETAIEGMSRQTGGNTQFGAVLVLTPLVKTAATGELTPERAQNVVDETTVQDAAHFYRSFEHVDVAVDDPPADLEALDVRRGSDAIPALRERELTFADVMELSAPVDGVARELVGEFERCFDAAESILERDGPVPDRAAAVFLDLLTEEPDTFITKQHDEATAREATERARRARDGEIDPDTLAAAFVDEGINPGTTADLVAGALFVALERGLSV